MTMEDRTAGYPWGWNDTQGTFDEPDLHECFACGHEARLHDKAGAGCLVNGCDCCQYEDSEPEEDEDDYDDNPFDMEEEMAKAEFYGPPEDA
jgi:hypothetical protein